MTKGNPRSVLVSARQDQVVIGETIFTVWWDRATGRPETVSLRSDSNLSIDQLRAFLAWCDEQPDLRGKE